MKLSNIFIIFCLVAALVTSVFGQVGIEVAFPNLSFVRPVDLQSPPDTTNRIFVVEQPGVISVFANDPNASQKKVFLDIQARVNSVGNEQGLLGLAFHPDYSANGLFYVDYTASNPNRTVISRFQVSQTNPDSADENSEVVILEILQPFSNHNGGQVSFGPDGMLYIALGDGGSAGDPQGHGQNLYTLLGSILRINVDSSSAGKNYSIPSDNPFVGNPMGYLEEIYAYGLRNPWRFSWDWETNRIWCGDVGQNLYEEVDIIEKGKNYGWNIMEGFHCFNNPNCDTSGLTLPVWEYLHNSSGGVSITGGFVYRGSTVPEIYGKYVYGDFSSGRVWALDYEGSDPPVNVELLNNAPTISSFGIDRQNELYFCSFDGKIYRFVSATTSVGSKRPGFSREFRLEANYPNPFNPSTTINFNLPDRQWVKLKVYDVYGRQVAQLVNRILPAGRHHVQFDGSDLSSGIYFYRIRAGEYSKIRRMLLVK